MATTFLVGLLLCLASGVSSSDEGVTRKLEVTREWETSCVDQLNDTAVCDRHPLAHVVATTSDDALHVLVSMWSVPSCLLLLTPPGVDLNIDWQRLIGTNTTGAITASGVTSSYGLSLDQLIEFDDPDDVADLDHTNGTTLQPLSLAVDAASARLEVTKTAVDEDGNAKIAVSLRAPPVNGTGWSAAGNITFRVEVLNNFRRTDELPHLQQTGNSVIAGVVLDKLSTNSGYKHSRFGVEMTTVGDKPQTLATVKSLDDEYTPGVFKLVSLSSPSVAPNTSPGFLQWRPVAYTSSEFTIEHSTTARHYNVQSATATADSPLLRAYFGEKALTHSVNVTLGLSEDGWYTDAKYASWELTMGLGAVPEDQFSLMVILLLAFGLGLPTVALIGGGVWMVVRRVRGTPQPSALLVEEE